MKFLSGFSGSNAYVLVTRDKALLWTDGRYFVQVLYEITVDEKNQSIIEGSCSIECRLDDDEAGTTRENRQMIILLMM